MITPSGNLEEEYQALKKGLGLYHNLNKEVVQVTGENHLSLLHNILTQDIKNIGEGESAESALLSPQGKILSYMTVYKLKNHVLLVVEKGQANITIQNIEKYIITEDVLLKNISNDYLHFLALGSKVIVEKNKAENFVQEILNKKDVVSVSPEAFEIFRVQSGIPRHTIDFDETIILNETGLDKVASSETKGCFPGQEVVARINTYKGWTKKLMHIRFEGTKVPHAQDKIFLEENKIGWITSVSLVPGENHGFAIGYFRKGYFDQEITIKIKTSGNSYLQGATII